MEDQTLHPDPYILCPEIHREKGDFPPGNYRMKIESFSQLCNIMKKTGKEKYESNVFEAGGYEWKLLLYPFGDTKRNGKDHISLYLAMSDKNEISQTCLVGLKFKFFVYDQIRYNYLIIQDGMMKRYHSLKREDGYPQLLPLSIFTDSRNGYLADDCCAFGVEVHVLKFSCEGERFKVINQPENGKFTWKLNKFSTMEKEMYSSQVFTVAGYKWTLQLYPRGNSIGKGNSMSLYLRLNDDQADTGIVYVEFKLMVKDQLYGQHVTYSAEKWLNSSDDYSWGRPNFLHLTILHDKYSKGYLVNDSLIAEVEIVLISTVQTLS